MRVIATGWALPNRLAHTAGSFLIRSCREFSQKKEERRDKMKQRKKMKEKRRDKMKKKREEERENGELEMKRDERKDDFC